MSKVKVEIGTGAKVSIAQENKREENLGVVMKVVD